MKKIYKVYCGIEEAICGFLFFSIVVLVFSSAFLRLFGKPLIWADDIAKLFFAWAAFLGADAAMRRCRLVGVDFLVNKLGKKTQKVLQLAVNFVILAILIAFVYFGFKLSVQSWDRYFQTISVSYSIVTLCLPVGSLCMILTTLLKIYHLLVHINEDDYSLVAASREEEPENVERQVL